MSQNTVKPKINIVPDTGFYIAAALKNGFARSYLLGKGTKFLEYQLCTSDTILVELQDKLESDKFGFSRDKAMTFIKQIRDVTQIVYPRQKISIVRDQSDNKIIECALEAEAEIILTFDKDLLSLKEYQGIRIIHPSNMIYL